jgi:hypothetical protein
MPIPIAGIHPVRATHSVRGSAHAVGVRGPCRRPSKSRAMTAADNSAYLLSVALKMAKYRG